MRLLAKLWLKTLRKQLSPPRSRPASRTRPAARLRVEDLESRLAPAVITTVAGTGSYGYGGDGGPATSAMLYLPFATAVDSSGNVFIADTYNSRIREVVKATGAIVTVAGTGSPVYNGDNIPATSANIGRPNGVAVDASGNLFIADTYNNRIREVVKATGNIITIAGTGSIGFSGDGGPATAAKLNYAFAVAVDASGNVYFADQGNNRVREIVKATGTIITVAGTGSASYNGDNIPATSAMLNQPNGVAVDAAGNVYIADWHNSRIREVVKATGTIITVAGTGSPGFSGDNGLATSAMLNYPGGVAVDGSGNIFIADSSNARIREVVRATGVITTVAGTGTAGFGGDGGPATAAQINLPYGVSVDASGNVYFADSNNHRIRALLNTPTLGTLSSTAWTVNQPNYSASVTVNGGTAPYGLLSATGLPPGLAATLSGSTITLSGTPTAAGTYGSVTLSVQDAGGATASRTFSITINAAPALGTLAPTQWTAQVSGYTGAIPVSGGTTPLTIASQANLPPGLSATITGTSVTFTGIPTTVGTYGNIQLTVRDAAGATASGTFSITINAPAPGSMLTIAGTGLSGYSGDGAAANLARLNQPQSVAVDSSGNVYIADFYNSRVREIVKATGNIITIAGTGVTGFSGDGGPATSAQLYWPTGVAVDASGNVFIADLYNGRIREVVKATGNIITVAGNGGMTDTGDGGPATLAGIASPRGVAVDASGNIFIADAYGNRIREVVKATGNIITVAGTGAAGFSGDGGPATAAMLNYPTGVAVDANGNLFIADSSNQRVREVVKATGNIITVAGTGSAGFSGDGGPATAAMLYSPQSVAVDGNGNLFIADASNYRIRAVVQSSGSIVTVAGTGTAGYSGDGGPATSAKLYNAYGVAVDGSGNLFIADTYNNAVREALANPSPALGPLSTTAWTVNQPGYSGTIPITNVAPPPDAFVTASGLPAGLSVALSGSTVIVSGTPTATGTFGSVTVTLRGVSGAPLASRTYSMTVNAAPALGALGWPTEWTVGRPNYVGAIPTSGGTGALTVSSQANLPPGLSATMVGSLVTFTGAPTAVGTYSNVQLTVRDTTGATATGTYSITINPAPTLGALSNTTWTANQSGFSSTVSVLGGTAPIANLTATGLPPGLSATQSGNTITISGTPTTAGTYNNVRLSVQDYAGATASGTFSITIAGPAVAFRLTDYPTAVAAGAPGSFTVAALDSSGNVVTGYRATIYVGSTDPVTGWPTTYTFTAADNGVHTFTFTLATLGSQQVYARDSSGFASFSGPITVHAGAIDHFAVAAPQSAASYYGFNVTVTAKDAYNNTIPDYTGTVHFTSSDSAATLPSDYTFTPADQGSHTFSATLQTAGTQTVTVNDSANAAATGTASVQDVDAIPGLHFTLTPSATSATAGSAFDVTVTALDQDNNVAVHYVGAVSFSSTDHGSGVVLPADYTFTAADAGVHNFAGGVTLVTAGSQSLSVVDTSTVTGGGSASANASVAVIPAPASTLTITGLPSTVTRGTAQTFTVTAKDPFGNTATGYSGTLHFTSRDPQAVLPADAGLTGGTGTFQVAFASLGTQSLSVTDTADGALTATQGGITVNPAPAVRLAVTGFPSSATAGATGTFSVAALDANGYVATGYTGTVHFTSSDPLAVLPADVTLTNGTGSFSATFKTAGFQSLSARDTVNASLTGTEGSITVAPAAATTLILDGFPTSISAGDSGTATLTARDAYGNVATGYTGTVHFTSSDPQADLPADYTFTAADAGSHTFTITFKTAATQMLTAADTIGTLGNGSQGGIVVSAAAVASLTGSAPANGFPNAGYPFTVWPVDAYGNRVRTYTGTVHFSSSDPQAVLPADYTYTGADTGIHTFVATFKTVGSQTITVTDAGAPGVGAMQFNVNVQVGAAAGLALTGFPSAATAGVAGTFTVRAYDLYGNTATGYTGTVHFTSSDAAALLPADYTFTAADAGVHTFSATLITAGGQGLWVQDAQNNFTAAQYAISVVPAAASQLVVTGYNGTTAGAVSSVTIVAQDAYGNVATSYTGTVHVSSSDAQASLPADYTFTAADAGTHQFALTLKTAGPQTVTFQDAQNGFSTTAGVSVTAAAASQLKLSGFPPTTTAGAVQSLTLTALDAYGNVATGYTGTVHFTSSDPQAVLPADFTFTASDNGVHTFSASLCTAGTQSLTATDTVTPALTASQTGISVVAGAVSRFVVSGYPATTAGTSHTFSVTAMDAYGNVATGYRGTVHFSSSDVQAALPVNYTFTATDQGVHTFSATLKTAGSQSLTAADTSTSNVSGSQSGIVVSAAAATHLAISAPANVPVGVAVAVTVTALDAYGNVATGYRGTIHFTSTDNKAILPSNYTFVAADAGVHTFTVTFKTSGTRTLTATDTRTGSIKGSATVRVS